MEVIWPNCALDPPIVNPALPTASAHEWVWDAHSLHVKFKVITYVLEMTLYVSVYCFLT